MDALFGRWQVRIDVRANHEPSAGLDFSGEEADMTDWALPRSIGSAYGHINAVLREHSSSNLGEAGEPDRK
jgi:hypothetical protein